MLKLFEPQSKVQKNRQVVRQTDARMAKYSRRGLVFHILIYLLCLLFSEDFYNKHPTLVTALTVGLIMTTSVRGYLLFRFQALYPRAPAAWRSKYFAATLSGAAWWGIVVASFTLFTNLQGVAPLLWLYTVVFFATTAHAFAPYQRFLSVYQFLGLVPAALCTFFTGEVLSIFYGSILLIFYRILTHHCELISRSYWERHEADYTLARKTESIEEEKRDTRASVALTKEFVSALSQRMMQWSRRADLEGNLSSACRGELGQLVGQIEDFRRILYKDLDSRTRTFNVRRHLQSVTEALVERAERKSLELDTALSLALPARVEGDAPKLAQVVATMISSAIEQTDSGLLLIEVEFTREYENSGLLLISLVRQTGSAKRGFFHTPSVEPLRMDLNLLVARGLAESLNGVLEISESEAREGKTLRLRLPMSVATANPKLDYMRPALKGRAVLLVHPWPRWLEAKRLELDALGFDVQTAADYKRAQQLLHAAVEQGRPIGTIVYSALWGEDGAWQFANEMLSHVDLRYAHHFVVSSNLGRRYFREHVLRDSPLLHFVQRPSGMFEFELVANQVFEEQARIQPVEYSAGNGRNRARKTLWIALGKSADNSRLAESSSLATERVSDLKQLDGRLEDGDFDLVLIEATGQGIAESLDHVRAFEAARGADYFLPVVGVGPAEAKSSMIELGVDQFVSVEDLAMGETSQLRYWLH